MSLNLTHVKLPLRTSGPCAGFTLIELMIAMTIGLVIVAAVVQIYVRSHASYQLDEGLSRVQENGRFAMDFLSKEIRMAGYTGCNSSTVTNNVRDADDTSLSGAGGLRGFRSKCTAAICTSNLIDWEPALPAAFFEIDEVQPGSDVIIIYRASDSDTGIDGTAPDNANVKIDASAAITPTIKASDILLVSDCSSADIFRVSTISNNLPGLVTLAHAANANTSPKLSKVYGPDARLTKLVSRAFYIKKGDEPGLFSKQLGDGGIAQAGQELVGSVESMKILYGLNSALVGSSAEVRFVVPALPAAMDWTKVVGVRLGILVRTPATVDAALDTNVYHLLDDTTSALDDFDPVDDTRRRRWFNTTLRLRNH